MEPIIPSLHSLLSDPQPPTCEPDRGLSGVLKRRDNGFHFQHFEFRKEINRFRKTDQNLWETPLRNVIDFSAKIA